jgi:TonB family protein
MPPMWRLSTFRSVKLAATAAFLLTASWASADDLTQALNQKLQHKIFVLRGFWSNKNLRYDATGSVIGNPDLGYWTTSGIVRVVKVETAGRVRLECKRLPVGADDSATLDYKDRNGKKLILEVELDPQRATPDTINSVFSKVFLTPGDKFVDNVPEYWSPCVRAGLAPLPKAQGPGCKFAPRLVDVLGTGSLQEPSPKDDVPKVASSSPPAKPGANVKAPRAVYTPDPEYSAEAKDAGFNGTAVVSLIVDRFGQPQEIKIVRPAGYGLDENAVAAVGTWKFEPARKDGQPVQVLINVEVAFHM